MGITKSFPGFLVARFFLGVTESGLFPGVIFYLSMWYKRKEQHYRVALFFSAAALAGAFGGVLAWGIAHMRGTAGLNGWAWIFILEGILTVVIATCCYGLIHNYPDTAKFLSEHERRIIRTRLKYDGDANDEEAFDWANVKKAVGDVKVWLYGMCFHTMSLPLYTLSLFMVSETACVLVLQFADIVRAADDYQGAGIHSGAGAADDDPAVCRRGSADNFGGDGVGAHTPARVLYHGLLRAQYHRLHRPFSLHLRRGVLLWYDPRRSRNLPRHRAHACLAREQCLCTDEACNGNGNADLNREPWRNPGDSVVQAEYRTKVLLGTWVRAGVFGGECCGRGDVEVDFGAGECEEGEGGEGREVGGAHGLAEIGRR